MRLGPLSSLRKISRPISGCARSNWRPVIARKRWRHWIERRMWTRKRRRSGFNWENFATGFLLTHQRAKATEMLQEIIKQQPEQYQSYELLGRVLEEEAKALDEAKKTQEAKDEYAKAAAN